MRQTVKFVSKARAWVRTTWSVEKSGKTVQKQEWSQEPFPPAESE